MPILLALALAAAAPPAAVANVFPALREADRRIAAIGFRLATANAPLCDRLQPGYGMAVHALAQYAPDQRANARAVFDFTAPVAVEAVAADAPAARAGVRDDDGLLAVDGAPLTGGGKGIADRDAALDLLERGDPDRTARLTLRRGGAQVQAAVRTVPACRARFELLLGAGSDAGSDGRAITLGEKFFEGGFSDEQIAVVAAHELAHAVLRHRERLDAAHVDRGLLKEVGRNARLFQRTEREADELCVVLLANAGYDPFAAARFWRGPGRRLAGGFFRARTHPPAGERAAACEAEARRIAGLPRPVMPPILSTRSEPLS